ncbi:MAG: LPXTG cell wall anchor domain-containing protein [Acidimicrobiales bacterium]
MIDVVTDDGSPLPDDLDLDAIARSMGFSYGSPALDDASTLIPESIYQNAPGSSFYSDVCIGIDAAPLCDQLGGAHYGVLASVATTYGGAFAIPLEDNEFLTFLVGAHPPASLSTAGLADVGGGWELAPTSFSPDFTTTWTDFPGGVGDPDILSLTLELTQTPESTTTTAVETTTTTVETTTTAPEVAAGDESPSPTLPVTGVGASNGFLAWLGAAVAAVGLGAVASVRRVTRQV